MCETVAASGFRSAATTSCAAPAARGLSASAAASRQGAYFRENRRMGSPVPAAARSGTITGPVRVLDCDDDTADGSASGQPILQCQQRLARLVADRMTEKIGLFDAQTGVHRHDQLSARQR